MSNYNEGVGYLFAFLISALVVVTAVVFMTSERMF